MQIFDFGKISYKYGGKKMGFFDRILGKKKPKNEEHKVSKNKYNIRCWLETIAPVKIPSMFPLEATAEVLPTGLKITRDYAYGVKMDSFSEAMQRGLFQRLSSDDTLRPFVMDYNLMEKIVGNFLIEERNENIHVLNESKKIDQPYTDEFPMDKSSEWKLPIQMRQKRQNWNFLLLSMAKDARKIRTILSLCIIKF
jgi:hypothetical protein